MPNRRTAATAGDEAELDNNPFAPRGLYAHQTALRLGTNNRAPINFSGEREGDFAGIGGGQDLVVGEELMRCMALGEGDLHLFPNWIESIRGDGINHGDKRLSAGQAGVGLIDEVERTIVLQKGLLRRSRKLHKLNGEQVVIIIGGYRT